MSTHLGDLDPASLTSVDSLQRTPKGMGQGCLGWYSAQVDGKNEALLLYDMPRAEAVGYDGNGRTSMGVWAHLYYKTRNRDGGLLRAFEDSEGRLLVMVDPKWCRLFNLHEDLLVRRRR